MNILTKVCVTVSLSCCLFGQIAQANAPAQYAQSCGVCHTTGNLNAPKTGDKVTWDRLKAQKGMDGLIRSTKQGMPQMPAKGMCGSCTDDDFAKLIEYMSK